MSARLGRWPSWGMLTVDPRSDRASWGILAGHVAATMPVDRAASADIAVPAMPTPAWTATERAAHNGPQGVPVMDHGQRNARKMTPPIRTGGSRP